MATNFVDILIRLKTKFGSGSETFQDPCPDSTQRGYFLESCVDIEELFSLVFPGGKSKKI